MRRLALAALAIAVWPSVVAFSGGVPQRTTDTGVQIAQGVMELALQAVDPDLLKRAAETGTRTIEPHPWTTTPEIGVAEGRPFLFERETLEFVYLEKSAFVYWRPACLENGFLLRIESESTGTL